MTRYSSGCAVCRNIAQFVGMIASVIFFGNNAFLTTSNAADSSSSCFKVERKNYVRDLAQLKINVEQQRDLTSPLIDKEELELCYKKLMDSDRNKNGILSREEYMSFVIDFKSLLLQKNKSPSSLSSPKAIPDRNENQQSLKSIMVFNHVSHEIATSRSCAANPFGTIECGAATDNNGQPSITMNHELASSIWLGLGDSTISTTGRKLRHGKKEPQPMNEYLHLVCTEFLTAIALQH